MQKLISWFVGFALGGGVGAVLIMLLVPASAREIRARIRAGYEETMEEARRASEQRRAELEAELLTLRTSTAPPA